MSNNFPPIIEPDELLEIYQNEDLVIVDIRNEKKSKEDYDKKHLKGALFVDLNTQLSNIKEDVSDGGRHPLPTIEQFSETLTNLGIAETSHVIIYDNNNGSNAAARLWWMLKSIGHIKVQVLNGGFQEAERLGLPMRSKQETANKNSFYKVSEWKFPQADIEEVERVSQNENYRLIDVRDPDRYNGFTEPIDLVAGHIPGAINIPFTTNLKEDGLFKSPKELKLKYEKIIENRESDKIIVHCGSGVTACHTILAMAYAGLKIPKLYVGSWSEWSRNNKVIQTNK